MSEGGLVDRKPGRLWRLFSLAAVLLALYLALPGMSATVAEPSAASWSLEAVRPAPRQHMIAAAGVLQYRLQWLANTNTAWVVSVGEDNRLTVFSPAYSDARTLIEAAAQVGRLELVDSGTEFLPLGSYVQTGPQPLPERKVYQVVVDATHFETADAYLGSDGKPVIGFKLTPAGDAHLAEHTSQRGYYLCLVLDGRVVNCPILRTPLSERRGQMELTGRVTLSEARLMAALLRSGSLPTGLRLVGD